MFQNLKSISFSKLIRHNSEGKVIVTDNGSSIVYAVQNDLVLKTLNSSESVTRYVCDHVIDFILLSPDGELICCGMHKQNLIQVWSFIESSWRCKISEGLLEISNISWAPDSRHLLVSCENNFKITIWSLVSTESTIIENPKHSKGGFSFSSCSKYLAVLERKNLVDYVGVYVCDGWQLLKCFQIKTENAADIQFSSSDLVFSITTSFSDEFKVLFYSIDGRLLSTYENNESILGSIFLTWTPNNNCVIFSDYYDKVILLDRDSYKEICSYELPESISSSDTDTSIYRIVDQQQNVDNALNGRFIKYEVVKERPFSILPYVETRKLKNKVLKNGIQFGQLSNDGQYMAAVYYSSPNILYLLNLWKFSICDIIIQNSKIKSLKWHPNKNILAFICGSNKLNLWTPTSCINLVSPYESEIVKNVDWSPNGESLILNGKDCSTISYLP